jgi:LacI family transcriptional regulator, galactose operon repressor
VPVGRARLPPGDHAYACRVAVTRDDVARAAGVSTAVVSYVLNDGPRPVSAQARQRVLAAIKDLGYRRDGVARFLRVGRTQSLGVVLPDPALPYFAEFTKHLTAAAAVAGHQMLLASSAWDKGRELALLGDLAERRVEGIVLLSADPHQDFGPLEALGTPIVVVDRPEVAVGGAFAAIEHLVGHGHTDLGMIAGPEEFTAARRRVAAWEMAVERAGLAVNREWVIHEEVSRRGGHRACGRLLEPAARPSALFVESDAQALGFLRAAHERGVRVPEDFALITAEGTEQAQFSVPGLTAISQPIEQIAARALDIVLQVSEPAVLRMSDEHFALVARGSCGCDDPAYS